MHEFQLFDITTAPAESRADLEKIRSQQGHLHNIYAVMAGSPLLLRGHVALNELFDNSELTKEERNIVLLTASRENNAAYSVARQSEAAERDHVPADVIEALRANRALKNKKEEALRAFTARVVNSRGQISERDVKDFLAAGYTPGNILEIVLAIGMVTLTNYTNLITKTPLDKQLESKQWQKTG
ncbi:MAG TPA: carboxymuconolactone decarboxylase family protein [Gammaproteobacteria bacterium]